MALPLHALTPSSLAWSLPLSPTMMYSDLWRVFTQFSTSVRMRESTFFLMVHDDLERVVPEMLQG